MAAPKGNRFWLARSSHGRKPIFASPEDLEAACLEYFEWAEENPLWEDRLVTFQGQVKHEPVAKMRAMTLDGLCLFLDIDRTTWRRYADQEGFSTVAHAIEMAIRQQKFAGAAADLLNANIIARDLGLADKAELTGKDGSELIPEGSSTREIARAILDVLREAKTEGAE